MWTWNKETGFSFKTDESFNGSLSLPCPYFQLSLPVVCFYLLWCSCFTTVWSFWWRILFYITWYLQGLEQCLGYTICFGDMSKWSSWWRVLCEACINAEDEHPSLNTVRKLCGVLSVLPIKSMQCGTHLKGNYWWLLLVRVHQGHYRC